jgi:hypothetical protein
MALFQETTPFIRRRMRSTSPVIVLQDNPSVIWEDNRDTDQIVNVGDEDTKGDIYTYPRQRPAYGVGETRG